MATLPNMASWETLPTTDSGKYRGTGEEGQFVNGKFYELGRFYYFTDPGADIYDPATGLWTSSGALFGHTKYDMATAVANGKIYCFGGHDYQEVGCNELDIYDPVAQTLTHGAVMPYAVEDASAAANGTKIYITGGAEANVGNSKALYVYDVNTATYTKLADMPRARNAHASAVYNNKLVVVGGRCDVVGDEKFIDVYDITTGVWSTAATLVKGRWHHGLMLFGKLLYIIGGTADVSDVVQIKETEVFDMDTLHLRTDIQTPSLPVGVSRAFVAAHPTAGYGLVAGGWYQTSETGASFSNQFLKFWPQVRPYFENAIVDSVPDGYTNTKDPATGINTLEFPAGSTDQTLATVYLKCTVTDRLSKPVPSLQITVKTTTYATGGWANVDPPIYLTTDANGVVTYDVSLMLVNQCTVEFSCIDVPSKPTPVFTDANVVRIEPIVRQ